MIGLKKTVVYAVLVCAAVVCVVSDKHIQVFVECNVINVPQPSGKDMKVAPIGTATQNAATVQDKPVAFRPRNIATMIAEGKIQPTVVASKAPVINKGGNLSLELRFDNIVPVAMKSVPFQVYALHLLI